jgi:hypothetical protein
LSPCSPPPLPATLISPADTLAPWIVPSPSSPTYSLHFPALNPAARHARFARNNLVSLAQATPPTPCCRPSGGGFQLFHFIPQSLGGGLHAPSPLETHTLFRSAIALKKRADGFLESQIESAQHALTAKKPVAFLSLLPTRARSQRSPPFSKGKKVGGGRSDCLDSRTLPSIIILNLL